VGDRSYEIALPSGAHIEEAGARAPGGEPVSSTPEPVAGKPDHYFFNFPLRPGETQFQVAFHLPYAAQQATLSVPVLHDSQHVVAVLPTSMQFSATGAQFSAMTEEKGSNVQVASNAHAGDQIAMTVSGAGVLADENSQGRQADSGMPGNAQTSGGPGGGLGAPIEAPDPLSRYRVPLLGVLAVVLIAGALFVVRRRSPEVAVAPGGEAALAQESPVARPSTTATKRNASLLEGIKEELFQLELDRQQGRISEAEYADAKAALDKTLKRATTRVRGE
jgi:hypothetical protein